MRPILVLAAVLIAGCASSPKGLERPEFAASFTVDQGYQLTLKRITEAEQECRAKPLLPVGQSINDVQHYPDLKEAKIVQGASGIGTQIYKVVSIKEEDGKSVVTVYTKSRRAEEAEKLRRWAEGGSGCS